MCHEAVFWYACDHLVLNETKCPFVGVIPDHGQGTTTTSFATDVCSLCKQPPTMVIEALKANQLSCFNLAEICEVDVKEDRFPDVVARFFAKRGHLEINQPDPKYMNAAANVASAPDRGSSASSSTTTVTTARASTKSSASKAKPGPSPAPQPKRAPASQNKKNPPRSTLNTQKAKPPAAKKSMPPPPPPPAPRQQTPQVQQQHATPKPMPPPPQRAPAVSSQSAVPQGNLAEDLVVYQALEQWQREVSSPGNNFTDVDFNALKSFIDLEKQSGYLPSMPQNAQMQQYNFNPQQPQYGAQMQYGNHSQDRVQPQRSVQAQANAPIRPCIQPLHQMSHIQNSFQAQQSKAQENTQTQQSTQSQKGVPYDGTNWGQEGVYLPRENYYVAGTKSPVVDPQMNMPPLPAVDPTAPLPGFTTNQFDNNVTFSPYGNLENFLPNIQQPVTPMYPTNAAPPAINHAQAKSSPPHVAASLSQQAAAPFQIQGQIRDPVANITPGDLQQIADVTAAKSRAGKPKPKPRSATTPTITIIDDYNENQTGDGPGGVVRRNSNASSVNTAAKDPTRGIKGSNSRVTKRASSPSTQKSSLPNDSFVSAKQLVPDMDASDAAAFAEQQQQQQGQYQQPHQVIEMSQSPHAQKGDLRSPSMPLPCF